MIPLWYGLSRTYCVEEDQRGNSCCTRPHRAKDLACIEWSSAKRTYNKSLFNRGACKSLPSAIPTQDWPESLRAGSKFLMYDAQVLIEAFSCLRGQ